jgi:catechol 2,3-dioxygenase-like lactoylglutathione lyase family enzyme
MDTNEIQFKGPAAYVRNLDRSRAFYEDLIGLKVERIMTHDGRAIAVAYTAGLSIWAADHAFNVIFGSSPDTVPAAERPVWESAFEVDDVKAIYERAIGAGSGFAHPLRELPWGQRTFRVYDPDRNLLDIGETHQAAVRRMVAGGMPREKVAEKICLPVETIDRMIQEPRNL